MVVSISRVRYRMRVGVLVGIVGERTLAGLRAEVERLLAASRTRTIVIDAHPADRIAVLARRAEPAPVNVAEKPGERKGNNVKKV